MQVYYNELFKQKFSPWWCLPFPAPHDLIYHLPIFHERIRKTHLAVQGYGLQYISASLSMMLSGSCIIFTAIASVWLLKRRLNFLHYSGQKHCLPSSAARLPDLPGTTSCS